MENLLPFLRDLRQNNNREWYHANKKRYEKECKEPFKAFVGDLIDRLQELDPEIQIQPKDAIFRIARDTRFSKDKTPYKTHVGALVSKYGRKGKEYPGYYFHLEPGRLMLGGGAYFVERSSLDHIWNKIRLEHKRFRSIIEAPAFVQHFEQVKGEQYKRIPKEFRDFAEQEPLIANKQYFYMAELPDDKASQGNFMDFVVNYYAVGKPLNDFVAEALEK
jgi:uncharacterized protein (TIGR02453 family)